MPPQTLHPFAETLPRLLPEAPQRRVDVLGQALVHLGDAVSATRAPAEVVVTQQPVVPPLAPYVYPSVATTSTASGPTVSELDFLRQAVAEVAV